MTQMMDRYQRLRRSCSSSYARESRNFLASIGIRNPRKFCSWYPESWVLETGIQHSIQVPMKKTGIQYLESRIHGLECRIQDRLLFLYMWQYASFITAMQILRKQPTFGEVTTGFPAKWLLRKGRRNSILMTRHSRDLGSASDWLNQISHAAGPIRSTKWRVISMEFLRSFLRRHLAGK